MESPVKKLNFDVTDKENQPIDESALASLADQIDAAEPEVKDVVKPTETKQAEKEDSKAVTPANKPDMSDEPILQENPQRFVLFPIKYHEVCARVSRKVFSPWPGS
jgi:ribonucleoside-diphosphate reductase subunit M2